MCSAYPDAAAGVCLVPSRRHGGTCGWVGRPSCWRVSKELYSQPQILQSLCIGDWPMVVAAYLSPFPILTSPLCLLDGSCSQAEDEATCDGCDEHTTVYTYIYQWTNVPVRPSQTRYVLYCTYEEDWSIPGVHCRRRLLFWSFQPPTASFDEGSGSRGPPC